MVINKMADLKCTRRRLEEENIPYDKAAFALAEEEIWQRNFPNTIPSLYYQKASHVPTWIHLKHNYHEGNEN